jgi:hypothetical protein
VGLAQRFSFFHVVLDDVVEEQIVHCGFILTPLPPSSKYGGIGGGT